MAVDLLIWPSHGVDSGVEQTCEPIHRRCRSLPERARIRNSNRSWIFSRPRSDARVDRAASAEGDIPRVSVQRSWYRRFSGSRSRWVGRAGGTVPGRVLLDDLAYPVGLGLKPPWGGREELDEEDPHVSIPTSYEEEGGAQQQSGESASSLLAAKRNLGHGNQSGKLATKGQRAATVRTAGRGGIITMWAAGPPAFGWSAVIRPVRL